MSLGAQCGSLRAGLLMVTFLSSDQIYNSHDLWHSVYLPRFIHVYADFFCKYSQSRSQMVCVTTTLLSSCDERGYRQPINEWVWLCANKTLFTKTVASPHSWVVEKSQNGCLWISGVCGWGQVIPRHGPASVPRPPSVLHQQSSRLRVFLLLGLSYRKGPSGLSIRELS